MKIKDLRALNDDELFSLSMQKNSKGCATWEAKQAQQLIWERSNKAYDNGKYGTVYVGEGNRTTKQYSYPDSKF